MSRVSVVLATLGVAVFTLASRSRHGQRHARWKSRTPSRPWRRSSSSSRPSQRRSRSWSRSWSRSRSPSSRSRPHRLSRLRRSCRSRRRWRSLRPRTVQARWSSPRGTGRGSTGIAPPAVRSTRRRSWRRTPDVALRNGPQAGVRWALRRCVGHRPWALHRRADARSLERHASCPRLHGPLSGLDAIARPTVRRLLVH